MLQAIESLFSVWSLQFTLGGFEELLSNKVLKREELSLPPLPEDSIRVVRSMRAASPPASTSDLLEQQQKRARREHKVCSIQSHEFSTPAFLFPFLLKVWMCAPHL